MHIHLREIDCSLAVVGRPAASAESGAYQYTGPAYSTKKCFMAAAAASYITTTVNKGSGPANEQSTSLRCLWFLGSLRVA